MESLLIYLVFILVFAVPVGLHLRRTRSREVAARAAADRARMREDRPMAQHPHVDVTRCIGCGGCVDACPEGDVLAVVGGTAAIVHPLKCVGHGLCAEACPVGAIEIVMAPPSMSADLPVLTPEGETNLENLFIVGELSGLALIKNAVNQGRQCMDVIARRLAGTAAHPDTEVADVCIIGAGPAGLSASLRAIERELRYLVLEQGELGGSVAHYPRRKLVMTSPVEFPLRRKLDKLEVSKEELLRFWHTAAREAGLRVRHRERVDEIVREEDATYTVVTDQGRYRARAVVLAIGRRGTPRRLGIPGEDLPKVMYSLLDAEAYRDCDVLVVGGGDSAVEAALGLAHQPGNRVTISYRRQEFSRIKDRNARHLREAVERGALRVVYGSSPLEVRERTVVLDRAGERVELANDYVWVFAGGTAPREFLERAGIRTGARDLIPDVAAAGA
jgi:thioredoxin reductase (NADPH)